MLFARKALASGPQARILAEKPFKKWATMRERCKPPPAGDNIGSSLPGGIPMKHKKIKNIKAIKSIVARLKAGRKKVVFTNGCFDILHVGHIHYLRKAKSLGDILVVGLNTDRSVKQIKGEKRPIVPQKDRAEVLASLEYVDYVVLFDEPDPFSLVEKVKPSILVKGADWPKDKIVGGDVVEKAGGRVVRIPLVADASSTGIIERVIRAYCNQ
jgi:rfaE bifunctional protein nucleotidyltransferase chain/domain